MQRLTKLQEAMLSLIKEHHFLSAPKIVELLHAKGVKVNKTSVYRNLDMFLEKGTLCRQSFQHDEAWYELREDHHDHIQCENCGKVEELHCLVPSSSQLKGFQITHHHLTLYGHCDECQKRAAQ